jgi:sugar lactone lactonase YvrE
MIRRLACLSLVSFALASSATAAFAQGTRLWTASTFQDLEHGTPQGVAIASDGRLLPGPESKLVYTSPSTYVWAVAAGKNGDAYLATGSPATVLQVAPGGKATTLFTSKDLSVQAIAVGSDGSVYAATLPSGKVYKLDPHTADRTDENATVVFDPAQTAEKSKYVWDLKFDSQGRLYVATGGPAAIYRVAPGGKPELFYKSDEENLRSLAFDAKGNLIAGSEGSGLVYRIDPSGKAFVIYDAPKKEITSVVVAPDGTIYAAGVGEKGKSSLPPLPVASASTGAVTATITIITAGSVQAANNNTLIPEGSQIYAISPDGAPRTIWNGHDEIVYALQWTRDGLLAATGNQGHIFRIHDNGQYEDIAHLEASQATGFADTPAGTFVATANAGKLYNLSHGEAAQSTYLSDVFDAGVFAQWGRAEVETANPGNIEMFARAGNVENPARAWGDWHPVTPNRGSLGVDNSRFVQWKLVLHPGASVSSVGIDYLPVNLPPVVDEVVIAPGVRVNAAAQQQQIPQAVTINFPSQQNNGVNFVQDTAHEPLQGFKDKNSVTVRWAAHDDNGDDLMFSLYYRSPDEQNWQLLKARTTDRWYTFDSSLLPDAIYRIKVVASDAPSHAPGQAQTGSLVSDEFTLDTTPPAISAMLAQMHDGKIHVTLTATDSMSPIAHAEYAVDAGRWQYIDPVGKISDSLTEHYDFNAPVPNVANEDPAGKVNSTEHVITVRVYDRYDNVVTAKTVVR